MHKLKLDSLQVDSFETTDVAPRARGTVLGNVAPPKDTTVVDPFGTYDVRRCGETQYFDCTFGCSVNTNCIDYCIVQAVSAYCAEG